jgi:hypothetical protein
MGEFDFYTKKMNEHCKSFFLNNFEMLDLKYTKIYSKLFPLKYQSSNFKNSNLFEYISDSLKNGINSNYSVYRDNDFIDYRLNYLHNKYWAELGKKLDYIDSHYVWYYFTPRSIPINVRELVVDNFNLLESFYINSVESHIKRFHIRGHVKKLWIALDLVYKNGFNKYLAQFNRFGPKHPNEIKSKLLNFTENGLFGLLRNADLYSILTGDNGEENKIQLLKFAFKDSPTNEPILINSLINELNLTPTQYLINKDLMDIYIEEKNEPLNKLRTSLGLPRIGEGWISETKLYYQLKDIFSNHVVLQHGKTSWLGRQHFNIYFPLLNIAIEYQGEQHFESVEYFGGNDAFQKNILRDKRKRELAQKHGCQLLYVEKGYDINDVYNNIINLSNFNFKH